MINLNVYDEIKHKIDKNKTWLDVKYKRLMSREISFRTYYSIGKRYNPATNNTSYYIIILDDKPENRNVSYLKKDDYGRVKIPVKSIWKECNFDKYNCDTQVELNLVDYADNADVYEVIAN